MSFISSLIGPNGSVVKLAIVQLSKVYMGYLSIRINYVYIFDKFLSKLPGKGKLNSKWKYVKLIPILKSMKDIQQL